MEAVFCSLPYGWCVCGGGGGGGCHISQLVLPILRICSKFGAEVALHIVCSQITGKHILGGDSGMYFRRLRVCGRWGGGLQWSNIG